MPASTSSTSRACQSALNTNVAPHGQVFSSHRLGWSASQRTVRRTSGVLTRSVMQAARRPLTGTSTSPSWP